MAPRVTAIRSTAPWLLWLLTVALAAAPRDSAVGDSPDYNRTIRPILADHCFQCHGPDDGDRQSGLRLDDIQAATQPADSGSRAIVPGKPDESELIRRIRTDDDAERMPPAESHEKLSSAEQELLARWIADGARAELHWSFVPPSRPAPPAVSNEAWVKNEIDRFVLARLDREGLTPSHPADRLTLVRRLYLDLIGLLPTPEEADAFVQDERPEAYAELVDHLLSSPHYGERWARRWLDLARYADTNGYEKDRPRSMWPYRDWVIRALNADMPFDRFTIEQIAGDMLPAADLDSRTATGFHRNTMINEEGGIDVEEFRFHAMVDRVATTGVVWLGLTIGCAQCHSHKFDPISQQEYYRLFALLNNADEPELAVPQAKITAERERIEAEIIKLRETARAHFDATRYAEWVAKASASAKRWELVEPRSAVSQGHATMTTLADRSILVSGDKPNQDTYVIELVSDLPRVAAIRLEALPHESLPLGGPGRAPLFSEGDFMLGEFSVAVLPADDAEPQEIALHNATHDYATDNASAERTIDGDLDTGWSIKGRTGEPHQIVVQLKQPLEPAAGTRLRVTLEQRYIHQMTLGRLRLSLTGAADACASSHPAEIEAILATVPETRSEEQLARLEAYYVTIAPELDEWNKQIASLRRSMPRQPTTLVMQERDAAHARATQRAQRGEFLNQQETVEPGVPAVLHPLPAGAPRDRLALARWLVDPANPLVARVTVNRHWQYFFGRGLVPTVADFGLRGEPPSHPELLDYLATELAARGWSIKQLHRLIVSSATYRQQSKRTEALRRRDPHNVLLGAVHDTGSTPRPSATWPCAPAVC